MGGIAATAACKTCGVVRPVRKVSGLCYSCHARAGVRLTPRHDWRTGREADDPANDEELAARERVAKGFERLRISWGTLDFDEQEQAAWDLIDAVEDLLGKE